MEKKDTPRSSSSMETKGTASQSDTPWETALDRQRFCCLVFTVIDTKQSLAPTCVHTLYSAAPIDSLVIFFCSLLTTGDYLLNNGVLLSLMAVARWEGCVLEHAPACCLDVLTSQCTIRPRWHFTLVAFFAFHFSATVFTCHCQFHLSPVFSQFDLLVCVHQECQRAITIH